MDAEKEAIISRIMKLLELGKDGKGAFTAEQQAANDMAAKLMAKYSIDFAELRANKTDGMFNKIEVEPMDDDECAWEGVLMRAVTKAFDCKAISTGRNPWMVTFCGTKSDLEISVFFYRYLCRTIGRKSELAFKGKRDQAAYAMGMVHTIFQRLKDLYAKRNEYMGSDSKALMVVKQDGLDRYFADQFPKAREGAKVNISNGAAYNHGAAEGHKVSLNRPIGGGSGQNRSISALKH